MTRISLLLLCLFVAFGCKKSHDPTPQNTIPDGLSISLYEAPPTTLWAFVTDVDGSILASSANNGGVIDLISETGIVVPDTVNLTVYQKINGYDFLSTYAGIFRVTGWHLPDVINYLSPPSGGTGSYQFRITDIIHSDFTSTFYTSDKYTLNQSQFFSSVEIVPVNPLPGADSLLLSGYQGNIPVNMWITNNATIPAGTQVDLSLNDFTPARPISITYDHQPGLFFAGFINIVNAPNLSGYAYTTSGIPYYEGDADPVLGYQFGFSRYHTHVSYGSAHKSTVYDRTFTIKDTIALPTPFDFTPSDTSLAHYGYSFPHDYSYNHIVWVKYGGGFTWGLYSAAHTPLPRINGIPPDLATAHPELDIAHLQYSSSRFVKYVSGETYQKTLNDYLNQHFTASTETYSFAYSK